MKDIHEDPKTISLTVEMVKPEQISYSLTIDLDNYCHNALSGQKIDFSNTVIIYKGKRYSVDIAALLKKFGKERE